MNLNKSLHVCVCVFSERTRVRGGLAKTTTMGPEMSGRNAPSIGVHRGPSKSEGEKKV